MKFVLKSAAVLAAALTMLGTQSFAATLNFNNPDGSWFNGGNWTPGGPPGPGDNARVGTTATVSTAVARIASGGAATADNVLIGVQSGTDGTVRVNNGSTLTLSGNLHVGESGTGTMILLDTTVTNVIVPNADTQIGFNSGSTGTIIMHDNAALNVFENLDVGLNGNGTLEIHDNAIVGNGGSATMPNRVNIGRNAGSTGFLLVNGAGATLNTFIDVNVGGSSVGPGGQGELRIVNGGTVNFGDALTGNLNVWGPGSGDRGTLSVDSTYTINNNGNGSINFVGGRLNFLGDGVDFINNAVLTNAAGPDQNGMFANVSAGNTATIDGVLSGNGDLTKTGAGTLILTQQSNSYRDTNINNGFLEPLTGPGVNDPFGLRDTNVNTGGTLRTPEGTPESYVINRDLNVNGGTFYAQVGGTTSGVDSDLATAGRNVNLDSANSHLFVHRINGYNPNNGDTVTIITALGALGGQFSDAPQAFIAPAPNDFLGLIQPFADYGNIDANSVDLIFGFAATFTSVAKTPNQIATAQALDAAVAAGCIIPATNVLGNIPINTLRHAYDLIAPEELASMYEASFAQSMVNSLNLQHRMDDIRWGSTGFCADGFVLQDNHGYTKNDGKSVADKNPEVEQTAPPNYRWGGFITGTGELTKVGDESLNDPGAAGYQLNEAGFTMGVDYRVTDHWAIGLSGGYSHTTGYLVNDGRLNTDGGKMGLYTTWYTGGFYVDASATGGWNNFDTRRTAFQGQETGSTDGAEFDGMVAAGYDWKKGCWTFGPTASFEYTYAEFNSFTESDTSLIPLHYGDQNQEAYRSNLGFRIAHDQVMKPGEGLTVVPELRAAWRHDFGPSSYAIDSNFVGCDNTFTVHGPWIGRDSAVVDLGLTAYCTPGLSAYIFYDGQFGRDNYNNNSISGGFRVAF